MNEDTNRKDLHLYLTPKQFVAKHSFMPMGGLRHLLFYAKQTGLEKAILRIGKRKILISEDGFFNWLKEQNQKRRCPMRTSFPYFLGNFLLENSDGASCYHAPSDEKTISS